ncbi:GNAT family N-acetyltransferase [Tengunoibacter tsumagoiensis]|uniref:N-acetyltransferase domain-containing protein n=1 Tax=Tengunoibacter tsumagoiensis TaxID=2014871 RepID=A0A402AA61_9CHLR|nr:GNAT family N-acetyltransferase [Tengunoibacter tsumagoiensis]GCE16053.1 hypothetical protein KTT_59120 [Tengunoibacter tsumagoiensis]
MDCSPVHEIFSHNALLTAIEENFAEYLLYCCKHIEAHIEEHDTYISVRTGILQPSLNVILRTRIADHELPQKMLQALSPFQQHQLAMSWRLFPSPQLSHLEQLLFQHGLSYFGDEAGMALCLQQLPPEPLWPAGLQIEEVEDSTSLQEWIVTSAHIFSEGAERIDREYINFEQTVVSGQYHPLHRFLGRLNGEAVATAALFLGSETAGLYSVGTRADVRRRGIGTALSYTALQLAQQAGYQLCVLESSIPGYHVYAKLGFREYCRIRSWLGDFSPH